MKFILAAVSLSVPLAAAAGEVDLRLVKDINPAPAAVSSQPRDFRRVGDRVYFNAETPVLGRELYMTDGATAPPELVADFAPGKASSYAKAAGLAGGRLIVEADDGIQGDRLLAFDRTIGSRTTLFAFGNSGDQRLVTPVAQLDGHLVFRTAELVYTTDGTSAGTTRLIDNQPYVLDLAKSVCPLPGGGALFVAPSLTAPVTLWHTDGPRASNRIVAALNQESGFMSVSASGNRCHYLFARNGGWSVWSSDGGSASFIGQQTGAMPRGIAAAAGGFAYVADSVAQSQFRLWRTDSSVPVATIPLRWPYADTFMRAVGDRLVFNAPYDTGVGSPQPAVFVSDGTTAGTVRVAPVDGLQSIDEWTTTAVNGGVLLVGKTTGTWIVDPAARTTMRGDATNSSYGVRVEFAGALVGAGIVEGHGVEPVRSEGGDPVLLHDLWQSTQDALLPYRFDAVNIGDVLYFGHVVDAVYSWGSRLALWRTDGSEAGTQPLPRSRYGEGSVQSIVRAGDGIVFGTQPQSSYDFYYTNAAFTDVRRIVPASRYSTVQSLAGGGALMGCDTGSPFTEQHLCSLRPGDIQAGIIAPNFLRFRMWYPIGNLGDVGLFFLQEADASGSLWRSDGTVPGTFQLGAGIRLRTSDFPQAKIVLGGRLLFYACGVSESQCGLYASDGSIAGTQFVTPLPSSRIVDFAPLGNRVAFLRGWSVGNQVWITDGSQAGTQLLRSFGDNTIAGIASAGGRLHFIATTGLIAQPADYYLSDGTPSGTQAIALPATLSPINSLMFAVDADTVAFTCDRADIGIELCFADADGSRIRASDIFPGPTGSRPSYVGRTDSAVYVAADDGYHGLELWQIKGVSPVIFRDGFEP